MKILHLSENKKWVAVEPKFYKNEAELQNLLANDVNVLPIDEIGYEVPFITIGKEISLSNGYLDLLAVSPKGHILIIETKLDKNPEVKRTVVGQILGYAANLWNKKYEDLEYIFKDYLRQQKINFGGSLSEYINKELAFESYLESDFIDGINKRLQLGSFSLLIVVDQANQELKDIANYLNDRTGQEIDFYVVELQQVGDNKETFLIPKLANPPRKTVTSKTSNGIKKDPYDRGILTKEEFLNKLSPEGHKLATRLLEEFNDDPDNVIVWRKTGFAISSLVPRNLYKEVNYKTIYYSYFFFQAGTEEDNDKNYLYFYYPEWALKLVPEISNAVSDYTTFYRSLPGYDQKNNVRDLRVFTDDRINTMIKLIKNTSKNLKNLHKD